MVTLDQSTELSLNVVYMIGAVASGTAFLTWFISDQFRRSRSLIYRLISKHNREDDDRFQALSDDIWTIRLRNASRDGEMPPPRRTLPRRRYLVEEENGSSDLDGGDAAVV